MKPGVQWFIISGPPRLFFPPFPNVLPILIHQLSLCHGERIR